MSLSEGISLNRKTMEFNGFVNLEEHTPVEQLNVRGDHALVFMFQQFQGVWVQVLGCFLSKNSVTSKPCLENPIGTHKKNESVVGL